MEKKEIFEGKMAKKIMKYIQTTDTREYTFQK